MIKILFLINSLRAGGAERVLIDMVRHLDKTIFNPTVLCLHEQGTHFDSLKDCCELLFVGLPYQMRVKELIRLSKEIKRHNPLLVQTFLGNPNRWGVLAAKLAGVPVIVTSLQNCYYYDTMPRKLFDLFCFRFATHSVACSEAVRTFHIRRRWYPASKIQVIHNSTDISRFNVLTNKIAVRRKLKLPENSVIIGTVASLTEQKGHKYLIEAAKKVTAKENNILFVFVGDGGLRKNLEEIVSSNNLNDSIRFLGLRKDIPEIMSALDLFVLPSLWEGLPLVVAEAMASGLPVIASNVDGIPEIVIDRETGILVPPRDSNALAVAILDLICAPEKREIMGIAGRKRAEQNFSVEVMVSKYEELYKLLIQKLGNS